MNRIQQLRKYRGSVNCGGATAFANAVAEREGFEPKPRLSVKTLNGAEKLTIVIGQDIHANTRKSSVKISNSLIMGNRWATSGKACKAPR
ncbi:MAG: hypothetical protein BWY14_00421 [Parcubacteria group bacterium ADurb.Bin192]|nr:MAG: hypothetical protein BWY14_00421 [Parcubacteria group bacterium ADurb.Bin192]